MADRLTRNLVVRTDDFPAGAVCMFQLTRTAPGDPAWAVIATDERGHILTRAADEGFHNRDEADAAYAEWIDDLARRRHLHVVRDQVIDRALGKGDAA